MSGRESEIVIGGRRQDWPGGARILTPRDPTREPNGSLRFGAEVEPDGRQVWFRITGEAVGRMLAETPSARGQSLVDALIVRIAADDGLLSSGTNRFEVQVSEAGEAWVERLRW